MSIKDDFIKYRNKHLLKSLILIVALISAVPTSLYFYKFHHGLSSNQSDWASFGSYIGGILGPIFSGLSLLVLAVTYYNTKEANNKNIDLAIAEKNIKTIQDMSKKIKENLLSKNYYSTMYGDSNFVSYIGKLKSLLSAQIGMQFYQNEGMYWKDYMDYFKNSKIDLSDEMNIFIESFRIIDNSKDDKAILRSIFNSTVSKEMRFLLCLYGLNNIAEFEDLCSKWSGFKAIPWEINYPDETE